MLQQTDSSAAFLCRRNSAILPVRTSQSKCGLSLLPALQTSIAAERQTGSLTGRARNKGISAIISLLAGPFEQGH